ncbi:MAG: hypothetical protein EB829_07000 [Nitrosopumilus sp. H8]|nr:MAG: hypothetical protein EB830_06505 [Nitrosopumilus sp. H13]RNJ77217.1 MAG: hypothetical protein EB829_07000 [Nitrosopumilus sp. H8]
MDKHRPSEEMLQELDNALSRLNAMEIVSSDEQKNHVRIMRMLVEGQMHSIREFEHLKKALDLLTEQIFKVQDRINQA